MRKSTDHEIIATWDAAVAHLAEWSDNGDFTLQRLLLRTFPPSKTGWPTA